MYKGKDREGGNFQMTSSIMRILGNVKMCYVLGPFDPGDEGIVFLQNVSNW
jgi:hypothetical protein